MTNGNDRRSSSPEAPSSVERTAGTGKARAILVAVMALGLPLISGCNAVKKLAGGQAQPAPAGGQAQQGQTQQGQASQGGQQPAQGGSAQSSGPLNGYWKLAFLFNEEVKSCHMQLNQNGNQFAGSGTDDHSNTPFSIDQGAINGNQVIFYKRYDNPQNPNQPPVEYSGTIDANAADYMSGNYVVAFQGKEISGDWEAQKEGGGAQVSDSGQGQQEQKGPQDQAPSRPPDLSGKWLAGFEYNFKTVQSTMWLEQDKEKVTGHGIDNNTGQTFIIEKGWYYYPKLTLVRNYREQKVKGKTMPARKMTFKAEVKWVNDADYQGAYMEGKTDGGGHWNAQRVR